VLALDSLSTEELAVLERALRKGLIAFREIYRLDRRTLRLEYIYGSSDVEGGGGAAQCKIDKKQL
jgi:hypothetical protein